MTKSIPPEDRVETPTNDSEDPDGGKWDLPEEPAFGLGETAQAKREMQRIRELQGIRRNLGGIVDQLQEQNSTLYGLLHQSDTADDESPTVHNQPAENGSEAPSMDDSPGADYLKDRVADFFRANEIDPGKVVAEVVVHGGTRGVKLDIQYPDMSKKDRSWAKELVKEPDGVQYHVSMDDNVCDVCGEDDGEFWYFYPETTVTSLEGSE